MSTFFADFPLSLEELLLLEDPLLDEELLLERLDLDPEELDPERELDDDPLLDELEALRFLLSRPRSFVGLFLGLVFLGETLLFGLDEDFSGFPFNFVFSFDLPSRAI